MVSSSTFLYLLLPSVYINFLFALSLTWLTAYTVNSVIKANINSFDHCIYLVSRAHILKSPLPPPTFVTHSSFPRHSLSFDFCFFLQEPPLLPTLPIPPHPPPLPLSSTTATPPWPPCSPRRPPPPPPRHSPPPPILPPSGLMSTPCLVFGGRMATRRRRRKRRRGRM